MSVIIEKETTGLRKDSKMRWNKFTINTTTAAEDILSATLDELGVEGVMIENNVPLTENETAKMFIDFPPELGPDDGTSRVSFFIEEGQPYEELLKSIRVAIERLREFVDMGEGTIESDMTEDIDWINNWKKFFTSFSIGDILIKPSWEELSPGDEDKTLIRIDPGISFGTGKHETTYMCIEQLQKYVQKNDRVLDLGCGSGILSIAALKLGAGSVFGTDIDEDCMTSTHDNLEVNGLGNADAKFVVGNLIDDKELQEKLGDGSFDLITANILADVIIPMCKFMYPTLRPGGTLITSGIIDFKEDEVRAALEDAGFEILEINHKGEWVNITARKY